MKGQAVFGAIPLLALLVGPTARGANEAYSNLNTSGFGLFEDSGGGVPGAAITHGVHILVSGQTYQGDASANLTSIVGGPVVTGTVGSAPGSMDTLQAFEGAGAPSAENTFANVAGTPPSSRADATGSGAIVGGLGFPFGVSTNTVADVDLTPAIADTGVGNSTATLIMDFTIVGATPLAIVADFTASLALLADLTPPVLGSTASATTSFEITIVEVGAGTILLQWTPNGLPGGITGVEYADPFDLNGAIATTAGLTTTVSNGPGGFRAGATLPAGSSYMLTVEFWAFARARVVPEPSTLAASAWLAAGLIGAAARARRSSGPIAP